MLQLLIASFYVLASAPAEKSVGAFLWALRFCRRIIYAFNVDNYPYRTLSTLWVRY